MLLFLYEKISEDIDGFVSAFRLFSNNISLVFLVILLMPFNWWIEVLKWKYSIQPITQIPFSTATVGVLAGIALGFVTPHAVGDYFAKVFSLSHHNRKRALGLILISRMMQMLPTAIFGLIAFYIFSSRNIGKHDIPFSFSFPILSLLGLVLVVLLVIMFLHRNHPKIQDYVMPVRKMGVKLVSLLAGLSVVRYLIFSAQFLILLSVLGLKINLFMQFMGVAFMFLAKSILPTFNFLSDLGIREFSVALFFESMELEVAPIIASGLILWLINIALPAFIGLFFIPKLKLKNT
ncbi:hypothetical protein MATR_17430 [Marivirga tractuosa]|uniref:lysylphosphatidylglycerol synthase domain-containing protein n=1 Tax=Marivirga tractuosa TaxID=1006 RepID=UPI0016101CB1|nr:hypothetical protein MATR_17430 [Marivirga tractuosa]